MLVVKKSLVSGVEHSLEIPDLDEREYGGWESTPRWERLHVQDAFPHLSPPEREFLISGITPGEWEAAVAAEAEALDALDCPEIDTGADK